MGTLQGEKSVVTILCDISSFYSVNGGGVKTYHEQKMRFFARHREHKYIMVIPANENSVHTTAYGKQYSVRGFRVSRDGTYRQIIDYPYLSKIMKEEHPDVLELGSCYLDSWLARISAVSTVPVITGFYHADFPDSYIMPALKGAPPALVKRVVGFWRKYVAFAYRRLDATIVASDYMMEKLGRFGLHNTRKVALGVDTDCFHPRKRDLLFRQQLGIGPSDKLLLFAGRFGSEKGTKTLLTALPMVMDTPHVHVVFVGSGPLGSEIRAAADPFPNAHVLDFIHDREHLATLYASSDLFLSPGPYETFGLSTLEAMSAGLPVVAAASGGAGELVVKCRGGVCFDPGDHDALAAAVRKVLASDHRRIGLDGRASVERFYSWNHTFHTLLSVYEQILSQKTLDRKAS